MNNISPEDFFTLKKNLEELEENSESFKIGSKIFEDKKEVNKYLDGSGIIFVVLDNSAKITMINRVGCDLFELKEDEIIGKNWITLCIPVNHIDKVNKWFNDLQNNQNSKVSYLECPILNKAKHERIIAWNSALLLNDQGEFSGIILSGEDVTYRKSAETNLLRREQEFRSLAFSIPDIVLRLDINKRFIYVNRAICDYTGKSAEYFLRKKYKDMGISENLCNLLDRTLEWTLNTKKPQKVEILWDTIIGKRFFEIRYIPESLNDKSINSILAIHHDITERKHTEHKLVVNEKKYRLLIEKAPIGIVSLDQNNRIVEANHKFFEIINVSDDDEIAEIKSMKIDKIFNSIITKDIEECLNTGITSVNEKPFISNTGMKRQLRYNLAPITDQNYTINGVLVILEDVTDRKQMEIELQTEKEKLDVTIQSIGDALISMDIEGRITLMNKLAEELTGWSQSDALGKHIDSVFKISDTKLEKKLDVPVKKMLQTSKIVHYSENTTLVSEDGKECHISYTGTTIKDTKNNSLGIVLVFRDITDKIKFEKDLLNTQKLESLGILAGGIAHDFNNILTGVLLNIQLSKLKLNDDDKIYLNIKEAEDAILRAKGLTQQLLTFAKSGTPTKKTASVKDLLIDIVNFSLRGSNVVSKYRIATNLLNVEIDTGQVGQVINNLVINAVQAMPNGGSITVNAENWSINENTLVALNPGEYVRISIADEGIGIHESIMSRIFDPYFTTKQKGSGLGLATSYSIIKNHDGLITFKSKEGFGSTFNVYLPASDETLEVLDDIEFQQCDLHGRVLVMDDDPSIRVTLTHFMHELGLQIDCAEDGVQAIYKFKKAYETKKPFDLVILDLTIPGGMGGAEAIKKIRDISSDVKAIVSSGYSTDPIMSNFEQYGFNSVIAKPYELKELTAVISNLLNQK